MIKKYTTKNRKFKFSYDGRTSGFIWNCDRVILVDGEEVVSSEFFK